MDSGVEDLRQRKVAAEAADAAEADQSPAQDAADALTKYLGSDGSSPMRRVGRSVRVIVPGLLLALAIAAAATLLARAAPVVGAVVFEMVIRREPTPSSSNSRAP
ncbi:MAG: hypothetical protein ACRDHP_02240 [Ktedonobacterales bacterium]